MSEYGLNTLKIIASKNSNIHTISEFYTNLLSEYQQNDSISIDVNTVEDVDITFIQLIESVRQSALREGKHITLSSPASGALLDMLNRGGFLEDPIARDFWT